MSWNPALDPHCPTGDDVDAIETLIVPRALCDLGDFEVRRALARPAAADGRALSSSSTSMGPAEFVTGQGIDIRPHPHIGLATVTYLYKGRFHHRDSLGTDQWIDPGAVNLMTAGHGITHSERSGRRDAGTALFPVRASSTWIALPKVPEDSPPAFVHAAKDEPADAGGEGKRLRLILGSAYGELRAGRDGVGDVLPRCMARTGRETALARRS